MLPKMLEETSTSPENSHSIMLMAVETCSKGFFAIASTHGKSPCFSRCRILNAVCVDERALVFGAVDGEFFLD